MNDAIRELSTKFFSLMDITLEHIQVDLEDADRNIYRISVKTPDSKLLIGVHGQTLELITHLLSRMSEKQHGKMMILHLEVNDYLKSKDERLFRYIDAKINELIPSGWEITLSSLTSYERKKVYAYIVAKGIPKLRAWSIGTKEHRAMHLAYEKILESKTTELSEEGIGI